MNSTYREAYDTIVTHLNILIRDALEEAADEQNHPSADSDRSDQNIKDALKRVVVLRVMRNDFETLMTGAIL